MKVRFKKIKWDTDGEYSVDLPKEVVLQVSPDVDLDAEGADVLADKYGYCVFEFDYEVLDK